MSAAPPTFIPAPQQPRVRFEAISEGWQYMTQEMGIWVGAVLITIVLETTLSFGWAMLTTDWTESRDFVVDIGLYRLSIPSEIDLLGLGLEVAVITFQWLFQFVLAAGLYQMAVKQVKGERIDIADMFLGFGHIARLIPAFFLVTLITWAGSLMCILPGVFMAGLLMLTVPIVMDQGVGAVQAMEMSFDALKRQWWMAGLFVVVVAILSSLGVLACCVGVLFTAPLLYLCTAIVYRDFFYGPGPARYTPSPYEQREAF